MSFLLDTDTCSAQVKGNHLVGNKMIQHGGRLFVSTVTAGELFTWALRANASPKRLQAIQDILNDVTLLLIDQDIAGNSVRSARTYWIGE